MTHAPLVIKLGGAAIDNARAMPQLWHALAELHHAESRRGSGIAIVHGGGGAVDRLLTSLGLTTTRHDGIRVTPDNQIDHVVSVLAGTVNTTLVGTLTCAGASPVGLSLADGSLTHARQLSKELGRVGEVTGGDPALIHTLWHAGHLPVVSSIAADESGAPLNVNADDAAAALAKILSARAVIFLTDVPGVLDRRRTRIESLTSAQAEALIDEGTIAGGMIAKVRAAIRAAEHANVKAVIASWNEPEALKALAEDRCPGTTILATNSPTPINAR